MHLHHIGWHDQNIHYAALVKGSEYDLLEVQRLMDGFMNISSSADARVLYEQWALRSTFLPMISPSMFTFTQPTTRPFFSLSSLSFCMSDSSAAFLVTASEALSLAWLNRLFILKVLMGGHPTTPKLLPNRKMPSRLVEVDLRSSSSKEMMFFLTKKMMPHSVFQT